MSSGPSSRDGRRQEPPGESNRSGSRPPPGPHSRLQGHRRAAFRAPSSPISPRPPGSRLKPGRPGQPHPRGVLSPSGLSRAGSHQRPSNRRRRRARPDHPTSPAGRRRDHLHGRSGTSTSNRSPSREFTGPRSPVRRRRSRAATGVRSATSGPAGRRGPHSPPSSAGTRASSRHERTGTRGASRPIRPVDTPLPDRGASAESRGRSPPVPGPVIGFLSPSFHARVSATDPNDLGRIP